MRPVRVGVESALAPGAGRRQRAVVQPQAGGGTDQDADAAVGHGAYRRRQAGRQAGEVAPLPRRPDDAATLTEERAQTLRAEFDAAADHAEPDAAAPDEPAGPAAPREARAAAPAGDDRPAVPDPVADLRAQAAAETKRIAEIRRLCAGRHADLEARAIAEGWTRDKTELEVLASAPRKLRVVDAWLVARDTNAANVKLHAGTAGADDITAAVAKGTTNAAIVRWTSIVDAKAVIAAAGTIKVNFSAAGSIEAYVLAIPVE